VGGAKHLPLRVAVGAELKHSSLSVGFIFSELGKYMRSCLCHLVTPGWPRWVLFIIRKHKMWSKSTQNTGAIVTISGLHFARHALWFSVSFSHLRRVCSFLTSQGRRRPQRGPCASLLIRLNTVRESSFLVQFTSWFTFLSLGLLIFINFNFPDFLPIHPASFE
jgi:hypothetical protein